MRIFITLIVCSCTIFASAQARKIRDNNNYIFKESTFTIYNYKTKEIIKTNTFNNVNLLDSTAFFYPDIFIELTIYQGDIVSYRTAENINYIQEKSSTMSFIEDMNQRNQINPDSTAQRRMSIIPFRTVRDGDKFNILVRYVYADSRYSFPLEGKLTITMIKNN